MAQCQPVVYGQSPLQGPLQSPLQGLLPYIPVKHMQCVCTNPQTRETTREPLPVVLHNVCVCRVGGGANAIDLSKSQGLNECEWGN